MIQPIHPSKAFSHLSLYIQKHLGQSVAVCASLWSPVKGRSRLANLSCRVGRRSWSSTGCAASSASPPSASLHSGIRSCPAARHRAEGSCDRIGIIHGQRVKWSKATWIDYSPYGSNNGMAAVIVTHYVGVAAVVDQGKRSIRSCANFILMGQN